MSWKTFADWAKRRPSTLQIADRLGRSRGRLRLLDRLWAPAPAPLRPDLAGWERRELAAAWIGHATVLLRVGGQTVLTDPVLSSRVGIGLGLLTAGPRRFYAPALGVGELPLIDLVLISHAHFDHLDRPTLARLRKSTPVICPDGTSELIRDLGFRDVTELRWGESVVRDSLKISSRKVAHWGARTFFDHHRGFCAFLLESREGRGRRVLYGGDTAHCTHFSDVGKVDLAIFGIGGYDPYVAAHATPEQAYDMANQLRADYMLPMHHSTFRLSYEPTHEPMERLLAAAAGNSDRIIIREIGELWWR
jgi:L-ascorbate metabolism protein UlaG (beta-lactamase superfamily)